MAIRCISTLRSQKVSGNENKQLFIFDIKSPNLNKNNRQFKTA
jgi:hypothetical protein